MDFQRMESSAVLSILIEWFWVPLYALVGVLFRLWLRVKGTQSEHATEIALLKQGAETASKERSKIMSMLGEHNSAVLSQISDTKDDYQSSLEDIHNRLLSIEAWLRKQS